jgi:hypothetical protein
MANIRQTLTCPSKNPGSLWSTLVNPDTFLPNRLQEDPKVLLNIALPLPNGQCFDRMAWGPDGTIAAAVGGHIHFIDSRTGQVRLQLQALQCISAVRVASVEGAGW